MVDHELIGKCTSWAEECHRQFRQMKCNPTYISAFEGCHSLYVELMDLGIIDKFPPAIPENTPFWVNMLTYIKYKQSTAKAPVDSNKPQLSKWEKVVGVRRKR